MQESSNVLPIRNLLAMNPTIPNESREKDSHSINFHRPSRTVDRRIEVSTPFVLRMGKYPSRRMNHKLANGMRCEKETGILPHYHFPWKDLKFYIKTRSENRSDETHPKSGPAKKHLTYQSI